MNAKNTQKTIFVAGHQGMVGSALIRRLKQEGYCNFVTASRKELDLTRQVEVEAFFAEHAIDQVYLAAAKVGGIYANDTYPAQFLYENLMIEANIIHAAHKNNVEQLLFLGSSCIYPAVAKQPMQEDVLLNGALELTNEPYAIAKIAGIKLCESYNRQYGRDYRSVMPTNLYGPYDNFHEEHSHVIPALLRRFHEAKVNHSEEVVLWGSGSPVREFLHVDDLAAASVYLMGLDKVAYEHHIESRLSHVNIGSGQHCSIRELAEMISNIVGGEHNIKWDANKPDGTSCKLLDCSRLKALGWQASIDLQKGLSMTYQWFVSHQNTVRC